jgi:hypothetical protein
MIYAAIQHLKDQSLMSIFESKRSQSVLFHVALGIGAASMTIAMGLFAYLGTFTRYLADDYCETVAVNSGPILQVVLHWYETASDRFSNLLLIALGEFLLPHNVEILPAIMILLWAIGLTWLVYETRQVLALQWSFWVDFFLAASLAFFSILEAPNRFQTIYWRSAMATHFAPLVYLTAFIAFLLMLIRRNESRYPAAWTGFLCLGLAFFGGGFSEPPDAVLIIAAVLVLVAVWVAEKGKFRRPALSLLCWTLVGGLLALLVMALSPGNSTRSQVHRPEFMNLVYNTILYAGLFISDTFKSLPLPTLFSIAIPFFLFYGMFARSPAPSAANLRALLIFVIAIPVLAFALIVAGFAPSVYGQVFPPERARFICRLLMTAALMSESACLGFLLAQWRIRWSPIAATFAMVLFALSVLYPLRTAWAVVQNKRPFYTLWSSVWDYRQGRIVAERLKGTTDIVTFKMYSLEGVGELEPDPNSWINVCAAGYYGVHSISAQ